MLCSMCLLTQIFLYYNYLVLFNFIQFYSCKYYYLMNTNRSAGKTWIKQVFIPHLSLQHIGEISNRAGERFS